MKKRYIFLALLTFEIASIPVTAQLLKNISLPDFSLPPLEYSILSEVPNSQPGFSYLVVSSNTAFELSAENITGTVHIDVKSSGGFYRTTFGKNAQMPGPAKACIQISGRPAVIYKADQPTFTSKFTDEILDQSVIFKVRYPIDEKPIFKILPPKETGRLPQASACETA